MEIHITSTLRILQYNTHLWNRPFYIMSTFTFSKLVYLHIFHSFLGFFFITWAMSPVCLLHISNILLYKKGSWCWKNCWLLTSCGEDHGCMMHYMCDDILREIFHSLLNCCFQKAVTKIWDFMYKKHKFLGNTKQPNNILVFVYL